uniref:Solute carrier family 12 member 6 n=1 Tax=Plectus sambesii TaxID=2011161 RepID=A0A914WPA5_9BILA
MEADTPSDTPVKHTSFRRAVSGEDAKPDSNGSAPTQSLLRRSLTRIQRAFSSDQVAPSERTLPRRTVSVVPEKAEHEESSHDIENGNDAFNRSQSVGGVLASQMSVPNWRKTTASGNLALYEDEPSIPLVASYFRGFTVPGPIEAEQSEKKQHKKANLGLILGVYLPTIQHIFGVTMFLRLYWCVGIMGVGQSFGMIFLCALCTLLTSISMSAIATNGVVESGGSYFMISRNLGPEFGTAVGVLFYFANAVATSMYLVGGVEIVLLYIFPSWTIGGPEVHQETGLMGMMTHNIRIYSTALLFIVFIVVALGVKFVQLFAPLSLMGVILSILAIYAGTVEKAINPHSGISVCMLDDQLLQSRVFLPESATVDDICKYCTRNVSVSPMLTAAYCTNSSCEVSFSNGTLRCVAGFPGITSGVFFENFGPAYAAEGESYPGVKANKSREVFQDLTTTFYVLLAIFFPSVTGIMTGSNMSGDLKDPQKSIPTGTIAAQLTTSVIYLTLCLVMGASINGAVLRDKYGQGLAGNMVVAELAWPNPWVLLIGSFTSVFGAALQCMCSAPRLLQSIAKDDVIPILRPFSVVDGRNEPIRGLILSVIIAECAILIGSVDQISPVVDFFFLMCYAFVNFICALHSLLGAPNWRPRFRFYHWTLSLLGAFVCFFIMFSTHWEYAIVSLGMCLAIYKYVEWKGAKKEWGDGIRGLALTTAQYSLMKIEDKEPHPKNWRPQLLILMKEHTTEELHQRKHMNMFNLASQLKAGRGLSIVVSFFEGDPTKANDRTHAEEVKQRLMLDMEQARLKGFAKVMVYGEDQMAGSVSTLIQSVGMGGLRPNTIMVGWPYWQKHDGNETEYWNFLDKIHRGAAMDMCLIVAKGLADFPEPRDRLTGSIDVWWVLHDGGLLLLISFLLKQHKVWRGCHLRLFAVAQEHDNNITMKEDLQKFVYQLRIDASVTIVEFSDPEISAYAYERTLQMEERAKIVREMNLSQHEKRSMPNVIVESSRGTKRESIKLTEQNKLGVPKEVRGKPLSNTDDQPKDGEDGTGVDFMLGNGSEVDDRSPGASGSDMSPEQNSVNPAVGDATENQRPYEFTFTPTHLKTLKQTMESKTARMKQLDREKVKKMHTAVRLNQKVLEYSEGSQLVVLNLPRPPRTRIGLQNYMEYLEMLTEKLPRVLLVRGTGKEVITMYS